VLVTHDLTPGSPCSWTASRSSASRRTRARARRTSRFWRGRWACRRSSGCGDATEKLQGHERVILDGTNGVIVVNPSEEDTKRYRERAQEEEVADAEMARLASLEALTTDGVRITIRANVDLPEEAEFASTTGAEGVGLMRTEFLVVGARRCRTRTSSTWRIVASSRHLTASP